MFKIIFCSAIMSMAYAVDTTPSFYSNYKGNVTVQVSTYLPETPLQPGALISTLELVTGIEREVSSSGPIHLSLIIDDQVKMSYPVFGLSRWSIYGDGSMVFSHRDPTVSDIPSWLWKSLGVKPYDFKGWIEQVTANWLKAREWATANNIIQMSDVIRNYPSAIHPRSSKEYETICDLMPSCLHNARKDPEVVTPFQNAMRLSWDLIKDRWMQENPNTVIHPSDQDIKDAEQLLIDMEYPIYHHED